MLPPPVPTRSTGSMPPSTTIPTTPAPPTTTAAPWHGATAAPAPAPAPTTAPPRPDAADHVVLPSDPAAPVPVLTTEAAVAAWPKTPGYQGFMGWVKRRCERIRGRPIVDGNEGAAEPIAVLLDILDQMSTWVEDAPPQPQAGQRFGNLAFRQYIALVEKRLPPLIAASSMSPTLQAQALPLLLKSHAFGHQTRIDYGTGHELAFALVLWCAVVSGWVAPEAQQDDLVLRVFPRYLDLVTKLQATYRLEPAGSHGVWGLDDYCFLPYLFGSAQLLGSDVSPADALAAATRKDLSTLPTDLYTLSLHRITLFKRGAAFSEHSPLLDSLAQFPSWVKVHSGLTKMYQAEVLGKRVVVQGLWIGGWCWGEDMPKAEEYGRRASAASAAGVGVGGSDSGSGSAGPTTAAPWATQRTGVAVGVVPQR